jgi:hypothetical protein
MGREVKRVPLDFDHPLEKVWPGFINTLADDVPICQHCLDHPGSSPEMGVILSKWYGHTARGKFRPEDRGLKPWTSDDETVWGIAKRNVERAPDYYGPKTHANIEREARRLAAIYNEGWCNNLNQDDINALLADGHSLRSYTHTWSKEDRCWVENDPLVLPTPEQVNRDHLWGMGLSGQWTVATAEAARLGVEVHCPHCKGETTLWPSKEAEEAYENWEGTEPPVGEGYQIWETVSEGSPISPVFATPEELARHMATTRWGADKGTSYESWLKFIKGPGWAPSMVMSGGVIQNGVDFMAGQE